MRDRNRTRTATGDPWLDAELLRCSEDYDRFNSIVLARSPYWSRQKEICESVRTHRTTVCKTGNGIGKSFAAAGILLAFAAAHPGSRAVVAAPTQDQLAGVLWSEVAAAHQAAKVHGFPLGGRLKRLTYELGADWRVEGYGSGSVESKSGRHAGDLLVVVDEASGVPAGVLEAVDSLNPSRLLFLGNPLRPEGRFFELCRSDNPHVNVISIPSTESPHIHLARSPVGMADATWLESSRHDWGEESAWWAAHVLAEFPGEIAEGLLPAAWLESASLVLYAPAGDRWIGVDLGEGVGGDPTEIVCRDDDGIARDHLGPGHESSNRWGLETSAERTRAMCDRFGVEPSRVVYDQGGLGADFDNRLRAAGVVGAKGYKGSKDGGDKFRDLRTAAHWGLRRRLDPKRMVRGVHGCRPVWAPQVPFSLPRELLVRYRAELTGARYRLVGDLAAMEPKVEFVKRLKKSPNFLDALAMTFAYPFA